MIDYYAIGKVDDYNKYSNFKNLEFKSFSFDAVPEDVIDIYVIYIGMYELLKLQHTLFVKFSTFKFKLNVINFGCEPDGVEQFCTTNSINYLYVKKVFVDRTGIQNINYEASLLLNFIYRELFKKGGCRYFGLIHHDTCPISSIDISSLYNNGMCAAVQFVKLYEPDGNIHGATYPWVSLLFTDSAKYEQLDFRYGVACLNTKTDSRICKDLDFDCSGVVTDINEFRLEVDKFYIKLDKDYSCKNMFEPGALIPIGKDMQFEFNNTNDIYNYDKDDWYMLSRDYKLKKLVDNVENITEWSDDNSNIVRCGYMEQLSNWVHGIGISNWYKDNMSNNDDSQHNAKVKNFLSFLDDISLNEDNVLYIGFDNMDEHKYINITSNSNGLNIWQFDIFYNMSTASLVSEKYVKCKNIKNIPLNKPYIYPINLFECDESPHLSITSGLTIPDNVVNDVRNKRCVILIDFVSEGYTPGRFHEVKTFISDLCIRHGVDQSSVCYADGNYKQYDLGVEFNYFPYMTWDRCNLPLPREEINSIINSIENRHKRTYKICCLNRRQRPHRMGLLYSLLDIIGANDVVFSMSSVGSPITHEDLTYHKYDIDKSKYRNFIKSIPLEYDTEGLTDPNFLGINKDMQRNTYIHIVTETMYEPDDGIFFSEKIFKPIVMLQPFILVSSPGALSMLRSFGYQTFPELFDESYDEIENGQDRLNHIVSEIRKVYSYSTEKLSDILYNLLPKLIHNANIHKRIVTDDMRVYNVLKKEIYNDEY